MADTLRVEPGDVITLDDETFYVVENVITAGSSRFAFDTNGDIWWSTLAGCKLVGNTSEDGGIGHAYRSMPQMETL